MRRFFCCDTMSISKEYREYLKSSEWAEKRKKLIKDRGGKCQRCKQKGNVAHHITYRNIFNEPLEDLLLFCEKCHNETHNVISSSYKNKYGKNKKGKRKNKKAVYSTPTAKQLLNACSYFNKNFNSLPHEEKEKIIADAKKWLKCWEGVFSLRQIGMGG